MAGYKITAPHEGDEQIAGVTFTDGHAVADELGDGALLYFRRHGYAVELLDNKPAGRSARAKPRG
ncbi:hypothetical protein [Streptomyces xanthochromogenes]|uniref:Uncharacterized protein n=1 Tax=Streptomyces xanthochromogenes TaxID=67384 RepID=A0ABQ3AS49_9ACTN|nr:hypothetical protein [Streptomyces xanthochromogenes]GGY65595.1 hypothetical protein GCM10010326_70250 [Streptomyces xanthochromogenes]